MSKLLLKQLFLTKTPMPVVADKCPSSIQLFISFGVHEGGDRTFPQFLPQVVSRLLGGFVALAQPHQLIHLLNNPLLADTQDAIL
jgi:hypothetical protein